MFQLVYINQTRLQLWSKRAFERSPHTRSFDGDVQPQSCARTFCVLTQEVRVSTQQPEGLPEGRATQGLAWSDA
jgi:hypothetical protein